MRGLFLILFLLLLLGCASNKKTALAPGVILDLEKTDYSQFQVIELEGEGECAGTEDNPCMAVAKFRVTSQITANPMQLLEIDMPVRQVKGHSKKITFEPGHTYTLRYEVLKANPADTIKWTFAGQE